MSPSPARRTISSVPACPRARSTQALVVGQPGLGAARAVRARHAGGAVGAGRAGPRAAQGALSAAARRLRPQRGVRPERGAAPSAQDPDRRTTWSSTTTACSTPRATTNRGIDIGSGVFIGRNTILSCKNGDIELGDGANIGFNCEVFSASRVTIGPRALLAAYCYVIGGDHDWSDPSRPVVEQARSSLGRHHRERRLAGRRREGARRHVDR